MSHLEASRRTSFGNVFSATSKTGGVSHAEMRPLTHHQPHEWGDDAATTMSNKSSTTSTGGLRTKTTPTSCSASASFRKGGASPGRTPRTSRLGDHKLGHALAVNDPITTLSPQKTPSLKPSPLVHQVSHAAEHGSF